MANTRGENEALDDGKHEEGMITQAGSGTSSVRPSKRYKQYKQPLLG
jgi:hypothetical protein